MIEKNMVYYSIVPKSDIIINDNSNQLETNQARFLLKKMLGSFDIEMPEIYLSKKGKPYFKDSNIFFNYSHSKNYIACAVSLSEVGIDLEEMDSYISNKVARKYLDNERYSFKRLEKWVKKESYGKLKGLGLQISFKDIDINTIKEKNYFIKDKDYICSIYCDNKDVVFESIDLIN